MAVYLREFLMDPRVIDIPAIARWILVHILVVPRRSKTSSLLYKKVWRPEGSPLLYFTRELGEKVRSRLEGRVETVWAMRYGEPTLKEALRKLVAARCQRITLFPLYPQYSLAATESSMDRVREIIRKEKFEVELRIISPFYSESSYLDCVAKVSAPHVKAFRYDKVLFSFHGLPERQIKKTDATHAHCLTSDSCCDALVEANAKCYRAQCYFTASEVAKRLRIPKANYLVGFQSRLGTTPWIRPYSDQFYRELPASGVKRLLVLSPSFVADCLETVEEISLRGKEEFLRHGGEDLKLVPSLNAEDSWADAVVSLAGLTD